MTLGLGEADVEKIEFPAMSLQDAVNIFSEAAYGKKIQ